MMNLSSEKRYRSLNSSSTVVCAQHLRCARMFMQRFLFACLLSTLILFTTVWPLLCAQAATTTGESGDLESNGISRGPDKPNETSLSQARQTSDSWADPSEERLINTAPRQYFKLHITPGRSNKRSIHKQASMRRAFNQSSTIDNQSITNSAPLAKQKISNATLKKLLNQSLMKSNLNGNSSNNSIKGSNFKFVFIQRSPTHNNNKSTGSSTLNGDSNSGKVTNAKTSSSTNQALTPSLAASVSKHLANSLLSSAVSMMGNLSNSAPSLSSLASHIVTHSLGDSSFSNKSSTSGTKQQSDSNTSEDNNKSKDSINSSNEKDKDRNLSFVGAINTKTKQPSKVYNLPVKFVTDGQPYHAFVLGTIKKHFATIKRLQQTNNNNNEFHTTNNTNEQVKRRKNQQSHQRLKGNSRFIYLPLKYLSNARPSKVISSKTLHKSSS